MNTYEGWPKDKTDEELLLRLQLFWKTKSKFHVYDLLDCGILVRIDGGPHSFLVFKSRVSSEGLIKTRIGIVLWSTALSFSWLCQVVWPYTFFTPIKNGTHKKGELSSIHDVRGTISIFFFKFSSSSYLYFFMEAWWRRMLLL